MLTYGQVGPTVQIGEIIMHRQVFMIFATLTLWGVLGGTIGTKKALREIGFHKKYYPKRYIMPGRRFRKFFRLRKSEIPKWIYIEFCMTFVYIALFVVFLLLYVLLNNKLLLVETFFWIYGILLCVDTVYVLFCLFLYRYRVQKVV